MSFYQQPNVYNQNLFDVVNETDGMTYLQIDDQELTENLCCHLNSPQRGTYYILQDPHSDIRFNLHDPYGSVIAYANGTSGEFDLNNLLEVLNDGT